jgi:very-short-patch-repair endonuclease
MIRSDFPKHEILENRRDLLPSGYEIDIFVKDIQLAIELNGPCHYFNIHGDETLRKVQVRDAIKQKEIQEAGFQFLVLDISTISDRKKLRRFLEEQYQYNIKPILL